MIKRGLSLLLALLTVLPRIALAQLTMVSGAVILPRSSQSDVLREEIFLYRGERYSLLDSSTLLKQRAGSEDYEAIATLRYAEVPLDGKGNPQEPRGHLTVDGEQLYFINSRAVYSAALQGTTLLLTERMALPACESEGGYYASHTARVIDGRLCLTCYEQDKITVKLQALDGGVPLTLPLPAGISDIDGYGRCKDGIYLLTTRGIWRLQGETFSPLYETAEDAFFTACYEPVRDAFYIFQESHLYRLEDGKLEPLCVLEGGGSYMLSLNENTLLLRQDFGYRELDLRQAKMPKKILRVQGLNDLSLFRGYNRTHPEAPAVLAEQYYNDAEDLLGHMQGNDRADVYFMDIYTYVNYLQQAQAIEPLDGYADVMAQVQRLYPYVQRAIQTDGKTYAVPYNVYNYGFEAMLNNYACNMELWQKLGLREEELPQTYLDLVRLLDRLYKEKLEFMAAEDIGICVGLDALPLQLRLRVLNQIAVSAKEKGEIPQFDTPELLELLQAMDESELLKLRGEDMTLMSRQENAGRFLFTETEDILDIPEGCRPLPLTLSRDDAPCVLATATVGLVNAHSENKTEAADFLAYMMENYPKRKQVYLYADVNETVPHASNQKALQDSEVLLARLEDDLSADQTQGGKNLEELRREQETLRQEIARLRQRQYYVNEEELAALQAQHENIVIVRSTLIDWSNEDMTQLMQSFYSGRIAHREFLQKLDALVRKRAQQE